MGLLQSRRVRAALVAAAAIILVAAGTLVYLLRTPSDAACLDPARPVAERVADLLGRMSLDEKIGQMTQAERSVVDPEDVTRYRLGSVLSGGGSVPEPNDPTGWADMIDAYQRAALATPLKIPFLYGADAVHGHNNVVGATIFPHNIGLGATRDPALVERIGRAVAEEVTGTGVRWDFAPCLCVARDDRWGRTYESFGEDPEIASAMTSLITGLQGPTLDAPASVLATAKHFVADGGTTGGVDRGDAEISEEELRAIHLPPFRAAVDRGVGSVMVSFSSWNGVKVHANEELITTVLKGELGFAGFVVSDWDGVNQIDGSEILSDIDVRTAINAGIDMVMAPYDWREFISLLRAEVQAGRVAQSRIDDAVTRIITKKFELGLFERPFADRSYATTLGSSEHRELARQAVAESQVLLTNNGVLPLQRDQNRILVAGRAADDIGVQSGGWTITWQGSVGEITEGTTILQGIRNTVGATSTVTYDAGDASIDSGGFDVAIAVVGEIPYAEGQGDRPEGLRLDPRDLDVLARLHASQIPTVVVLVSGRPLDVADHLTEWDALVEAWLPGTEGQGVADVLFNVVRPSGTLPVTWPRSSAEEPVNHGDGQEALFPYGFGLTYSGSST